nr:integrase, catalytic region, zinc finger, CCHC-type, peptidase aspartic, catalytic [Tanacetum cinerariifolium]
GPNNAFDDDVDEQPIQDLALSVDNVFQAEDCDAFDSDVDKAPTAQTMSWPICHQLILLLMKPDHLMIWIFCLRSKKNTKCVNAANEELTAAKHKLMLLI